MEIISRNDGKDRLQYKAYTVTGGSLPSEVPLAHIRRGPYQSLLDKVAKALQ